METELNANKARGGRGTMETRRREKESSGSEKEKAGRRKKIVRPTNNRAIRRASRWRGLIPAEAPILIDRKFNLEWVSSSRKAKRSLR